MLNSHHADAAADALLTDARKWQEARVAALAARHRRRLEASRRATWSLAGAAAGALAGLLLAHLLVLPVFAVCVGGGFAGAMLGRFLAR